MSSSIARATWKNRPVIDVQNLVPLQHHRQLVAVAGRQYLGGTADFVLAGQVLLKYQRIDHYSDRHTRCLDVKILLEMLGDGLVGAFGQGYGFHQDDGGVLHPCCKSLTACSTASAGMVAAL